MNNYMASFIKRADNYIDKNTTNPFLKSVVDIKNNFEVHKEKICVKQVKNIPNILDNFRENTTHSNQFMLKN